MIHAIEMVWVLVNVLGLGLIRWKQRAVSVFDRATL